MEITIPFNYTPRDYQIPLLQYIDNGGKRAVAIWHRRAGKDLTLINLIAKKMMERVGTYYYFFPTYNQGKKILWNGIDRDGFKFLDHIPKELRKRTNGSEMLIELKNGSVFQIVGTDNSDSVVGTNPIGCVFSEYALQNPIAWGYIRPILLENGGWAVFNYTSRGRNHGYTLLEYARSKKDWFIQVLSAEYSGVFTKEQLEEEREQYINEDGDDLRFRQEYLCSFDGAIQGSYYGKIMQNIQDNGQIKESLPLEDYPVDTYWDLGVGDSTAIWFVQSINTEHRIIDYYEANGEGLGHYAKVLKDKGYLYGKHTAPHDIAVRELSSGKSRLEIAKADFGIDFEVAPKLSLDDGIQATRKILRSCYFHEKNCARGIDCLRNYHKKYNEEMKVYSDKPLHDWSSNGADAFRYFAIGYQDDLELEIITKDTTDDIFY